MMDYDNIWREESLLEERWGKLLLLVTRRATHDTQNWLDRWCGWPGTKHQIWWHGGLKCDGAGTLENGTINCYHGKINVLLKSWKNNGKIEGLTVKYKDCNKKGREGGLDEEKNEILPKF